MRDELLRTVAAMRKAGDLFRRGEILEGYEVSVDGVRLYLGRYFGQAALKEQCVHKGTEIFSPSVPVLPYIVTFQVGKISAEKRPMLSVICALSLEDLLYEHSDRNDRSYHTKERWPGTGLSSDTAEEISRLEMELAQEEVRLDVYRFTELNYAVLSLRVD